MVTKEGTIFDNYSVRLSLHERDHKWFIMFFQNTEKCCWNSENITFSVTTSNPVVIKEIFQKYAAFRLVKTEEYSIGKVYKVSSLEDKEV